jgi:hypothetical protein
MPVAGPVLGAVAGAVVSSALAGDGGGGGIGAEGAYMQGQAALETSKIGREQWEYYKTNFQPLEKDLVKKAGDYLGRTFGSAEEQEEAAGEAHADVMQATGRATEARERSLAGFGINPASGRFASESLKSSLDTARTDALAQNLARRGVRDEALGKEIAMTNAALNIQGVGKGLPAAAATTLASAGAQAGAAANSAFLRSNILAQQGREGMAPVVSAVSKGIQKWWDAPASPDAAYTPPAPADLHAT